MRFSDGCREALAFDDHRFANGRSDGIRLGLEKFRRPPLKDEPLFVRTAQRQPAKHDSGQEDNK